MGVLTKAAGFFGGFNLQAWAITVGVVALVSAGTATLFTANYYNNKIISASTSAAQKSYDKAIQAQKKADGDMYAAGQKAQKATDDRERADDAKKPPVIKYIHDHAPVDPTGICKMPAAAAAEINKVLQ